MHIPDGYLSPATCAALWAGSAPFWVVAVRRVKRVFTARTIPLVAVAAAFSFVVMMFNIPLPGGTTGHATGVAIAAIVLGPWMSSLAISVALAIQALLFGDGGITTFGANAFNIAIAGSFVAWFAYRLVSRGAAPGSRRHVVAAGLAGYVAINASAFLTAFELGIQPRLFHDATGTPLYAPYPLAIAIPAMMLGHLLIAGFAEGLLTAGVVRWAQRAEPRLLERASSDRADAGTPPRLRPLWTGVAVFMILVPIGLFAAGTAWGEWSAGDLTDPATRAQIITASANTPLPAATPAGLERLASIWSAPLPDYAPAFLRSAALGYALSALFGTGLIILLTIPLGAALGRTRRD